MEEDRGKQGAIAIRREKRLKMFETCMAPSERKLRRLFAYLWASPATVLGLALLPLALLDGGATVVDGVLELHGRFVRLFLTHCTLLKGGASAMTLGHVVLGRDEQLLALTRAHERVHVRQYERWGPFFIPAYVGISIFLWLRGRPAYRDNPFEREAFGD